MDPLSASANVPGKRLPWRRLAWTAGLAGVVLAGLALWWVWARPAVPDPPAIALDGMDPPVVQIISRALDRVRQERRSGAAWGYLGQVLEVHGLYAQALECFVQAARLDPHEPRWPYRRAYLLGFFQDPDKALPYLRRAVALAAKSDPDNNVPRLRLAETLLEMGRLEEAEEHLTRVARVEPANARLQHALGLLSLARNNPVAAQEHLSQAADSPEARRKACAQLARLFQQQGNETAAAEFSRRAAALPPDEPWSDPYEAEYGRIDKTYMTLYRKTQQLEEQGKKEELLQALRELNRDFPNNRSALALGTTLARMGELSQAEAIFRRALEQSDLRIPAHCCLGIGLYEQGRRLWDTPGQREQASAKVQEAVEHLNEARQRKPDSALAHLYHGLAVQLLGRPEEALRSFRLCIECRPEWVDGHLRLGQLLAEQGENAEACRALEQAVQLAPATDSRARQALEQVRARKTP